MTEVYPFRSIPSFVYALLIRNPRLVTEFSPDVHGYASTIMAFIVAARHLSLTHEAFKSTEKSGFTIIVNKTDLGRPEESTICAFSRTRDRIVSGDTSRYQYKNVRHQRYVHVTIEVTDTDDVVNNPT